MRGTTTAPGSGTGRLRDALDQAVWESTAVGLAGWQLGLGVLAWLRATQHAGPLLLAHGLLVLLTATAVVLVHRAPRGSASCAPSPPRRSTPCSCS